MSSSSTKAPAARGTSPLVALVLGLPLAAGLIALFRYGPLKNSPVARYVEYEVQWVLVAFFCVAVAALLLKWLRLRIEFDALDRDLLPRWDGRPVAVDKAPDLLASLNRQHERVLETYLGRRIQAALDFLVQRKSTAQYDDRLRSPADCDAMTQENSFGLVRFLTWAIPILGFLGTVLGITKAISGVTPESLEENVGSLTGGLAEAFDSTALGLSLTMVVMFISYLVERREQSMLADVDRTADATLAHRFVADHGTGGAVSEMVQQSSQALAHAIEALAARQAETWAGVLEQPQRQAAATYQRMTEQLVVGLGEAMQRTLVMHEERLHALEHQSVQAGAQLMQQLAGLAVAVRDTGREQQQALMRVAEGVAGQASLLAKIQEDESNLVHLQAVLHQNLAALASASSFEEAVHSLTAAVHLLTSRATAAQAPATYPRRAA